MSYTEDREVRYDLDQSEMESFETELITAIADQAVSLEIAAAWIRPFSRYANLMRSIEATFFPEAQEVSMEDEERSIFFALIDFRLKPRITFGSTICGARVPGDSLLATPSEVNGDSSGFIFIDQLIRIGNFTLEEFDSYISGLGLNPKHCLSVESTYRIGELADKWHGLSLTEVAYWAFFRSVRRNGGAIGTAAIFASINEPAMDSFRRFGLHFEPLMGRTDLVTPEEELGKTFIPIVMTYDQYADDLFSTISIPLAEFAL